MQVRHTSFEVDLNPSPAAMHLQNLQQFQSSDSRKGEAVNLNLLIAVHDRLIVPGLQTSFDVLE
jgi:hypothetical protein